MTKFELVRLISERMNVEHVHLQPLVQHVLDEIVQIIADKGRLELRNFGIFEVKQRKGRQGRNPRTGQLVAVPVRRVVRFMPGKAMLQKLNKAAQGQ